jgi:hypothetical protein
MPLTLALDLRVVVPCSVHTKYQGIVMLARVIDKARAAAHGHLGEYLYNGPMDKAVLGFLGMDDGALFEVVRGATDDCIIDEYVATFVGRKAPHEITEWNTAFLNYVPAPESGSWRRLVELRKRHAPDRFDVVTWADVLDLEEGRVVPRRAAS